MLVQAAVNHPMLFKRSDQAVFYLDGPPEPVSTMVKSGCPRGVCLQRKNMAPGVTVGYYCGLL